MEIRVIVESEDKVYNGEQFGVDENSSPKDILAAVAKPVLEETGVNIEKDGYVVNIASSKDDANVKTAYVNLKPTAGK